MAVCDVDAGRRVRGVEGRGCRAIKAAGGCCGHVATCRLVHHGSGDQSESTTWRWMRSTGMQQTESSFRSTYGVSTYGTRTQGCMTGCVQGVRITNRRFETIDATGVKGDAMNPTVVRATGGEGVAQGANICMLTRRVHARHVIR
ncbi:MAG: hypothetical protein R3F28_03305 [Candidatus Kapaibacterium sp.]